MPTLNWIGKEKIVNHDKEVPFRLLKKDGALSFPKNGSSENLIVEGDNLEALKALMPHYVGKIKCVYIDPPYNTGNEGWVYNDNVNSPQIKKWIGETVGAEGEDLSRHDKWLCMMYPRLKLLRDLLSDDGVIFVSIDDNEHCNLKQIMDEIFGEKNFVGTLIWQRAKGGGNAKEIVRGHEYIVVYKKIAEFDLSLTQQGAKSDDHLERAKKKSDKYIEKNGVLYFINDDVIRRVFGKYKKGEERRCEYEDLLIFKNQKVKDEIDAKIASGEYMLKKNKNGKHYICRLEPVGSMRQKMYTIINGFLSEVGKNDLANLDMENSFDYPKPVGLIKTLIDSVCSKDSIILDSFAGSGTTGQAVLDLNQDGGDRKFILVELESKNAQEITSERVRRVAKKMNGSFEYATLGETLFAASGNINDAVLYQELANYIYFTETHTILDPKKVKNPTIGEYDGTEYYLLFKEKGNNKLSKSFLKSLKKGGAQKIVYADFCDLPVDILQAYNIIFKQIPYEVRVY